MKRIRWSPAAVSDLENIRNYLAANRPALAQSTIRSLYAAARSLKTSSYRGRLGRNENTRELVMAPMPYIIVYAVEPNAPACHPNNSHLARLAQDPNSIRTEHQLLLSFRFFYVFLISAVANFSQ